MRIFVFFLVFLVFVSLCYAVNITKEQNFYDLGSDVSIIILQNDIACLLYSDDVYDYIELVGGIKILMPKLLENYTGGINCYQITEWGGDYRVEMSYKTQVVGGGGSTIAYFPLKLQTTRINDSTTSTTLNNHDKGKLFWAIIIGGGIYLYYFFFKKRKKTPISEDFIERRKIGMREEPKEEITKSKVEEIKSEPIDFKSDEFDEVY